MEKNSLMNRYVKNFVDEDNDDDDDDDNDDD